MVPTSRATMMFLATFIATQSKIDITDTQIVGRISSASIYANSMSILRKTYEKGKSENSVPKKEPPPIFDWHEFGIIMFMAKNRPAKNVTTMTTNETIDSTVTNTVIGNLTTTMSAIKTKDKATKQSRVSTNSTTKPTNTSQKQKKVQTFTTDPSTGYRDISIVASVCMVVAVIFACAQVGREENDW